MKVIIPKNCTKKQSIMERHKGMASIGASAYMEVKPKISVQAVRSKGTKVAGTPPIKLFAEEFKE